jgi:hypothetical protein
MSMTLATPEYLREVAKNHAGGIPMNALRDAADEIDRLSRQLAEAQGEVERLRLPWRAVDGMDWEYIFSSIGYGGRDRFWRAVLTEMRANLAHAAAMGTKE